MPKLLRLGRAAGARFSATSLSMDANTPFKVGGDFFAERKRRYSLRARRLSSSASAGRICLSIAWVLHEFTALMFVTRRVDVIHNCSIDCLRGQNAASRLPRPPAAANRSGSRPGIPETSGGNPGWRYRQKPLLIYMAWPGCIPGDARNSSQFADRQLLRSALYWTRRGYASTRRVMAETAFVLAVRQLMFVKPTQYWAIRFHVWAIR